MFPFWLLVERKESTNDPTIKFLDEKKGTSTIIVILALSARGDRDEKAKQGTDNDVDASACRTVDGGAWYHTVHDLFVIVILLLSYGSA